MRYLIEFVMMFAVVIIWMVLFKASITEAIILANVLRIGLYLELKKGDRE